jgi:hypothetical protein
VDLPAGAEACVASVVPAKRSLEGGEPEKKKMKKEEKKKKGKKKGKKEKEKKKQPPRLGKFPL